MTTRIARLQMYLAENAIEAILVTDQPNKFYLSGFNGSDVALLLTHDVAWIIADGRYLEEIKTTVNGFDIIDNQGDLTKAIVTLVTYNQLTNLAVESEALTLNRYLGIKKGLANQCDILPTEYIIEKMRMIKDPRELAKLTTAAELTDLVYDYCLQIARPGMSERALAAKMTAYMTQLGADGSAFETIVASGLRSAMPHGHASQKLLAKGELVTVDFGVRYQGYFSDMTRTFAMGQVEAELKTIYQIVNDAGLKTLQAAKAGVTTGELDQFCRELITKSGYGAYFNHGTGHGLGLSCHEYPYIKEGLTERLEKGMTFTIEPGIYLPSFGGVRIEDDVHLNQKGFGESLTKSTRDWIEL